MRRIMSFMLGLTLTAALFSGCGKKNTSDDSNKTAQGYELALVTDVGTINDKSFNQGAWEGLTAYADEHDKTYKYYQPTEATTAAILDSINLAVRGGAKLVVCPGFKFAEALYEAQTTYPEVKFIILDSQPEKDSDVKINDNVYSIFYAEEQAGFLAGYAAVKEGYTKLGFMGGMAAPAVVRFGLGYVLGAETAAKELGIEAIDMKYHYTGSFSATPEAQTTAASWYQSGTQVIFGCGGAVGNSVMAAAQDANGKVIGVDVDQSSESTTVITSAMKLLSKSVYDGITSYYEGVFPGGQAITLDVTTQSIGLPMETSKFENFTQADYEEVYARLVSGEYAPEVDGISEVTELPLSIVKIDEVK